jgi:adenylate kinase family enzyme
MHKFFVLGVSGSGKTTLAKQLGKKYGLQVIELDDIFWVKKYTDMRSVQECETLLREKLSSLDGWVVEGVYDWGKVAADRADVVIWLKPPLWIAALRILKRWLFDWTREKKESPVQIMRHLRYLLSYRKIVPGQPYSTESEHKLLVSGNEDRLVIVKTKNEAEQFLYTS